MTGARKALLAAAVVALLTIPGIAVASGAFDGGDDQATIVDDQGITATIESGFSVDEADDSAGDPSDDLDEAIEVEDSSDDLDEAIEVEDSSDDLDEASEVEDSSEDLDESDDEGSTADEDHSSSDEDDQADDEADDFED
jgi:hypothetical protein